MFSRLLATVAAFWVGYLPTVTSADEYPEFVGVYLKIAGTYVEVPEVPAFDRVSIWELEPIRSPSGRLLHNEYGVEMGTRFNVFQSTQIASSPKLDGALRGIFVRTQYPPEEVFVEAMTGLATFATVQNPRPSTTGILAKGRRGKYQDNNDLIVRTNCGFNKSQFNIKLVDSTAVEFVPKQDLNLSYANTIGLCGQSNTAKAKAALIGLGKKQYIFRLQ